MTSLQKFLLNDEISSSKLSHKKNPRMFNPPTNPPRIHEFCQRLLEPDYFNFEAFIYFLKDEI